MSYKKIFISGAAGYIGSTLCKTLLELGHTVIAYDNLMYGQAHSLFSCLQYKDRFKFILGDVKDLYNLYEESKDCDVIIPLAALVGAPLCSKDPEDAYDTNTKPIVFLSKEFGKDKIILLPVTNSGYGVGGNGMCDETSPLNPISIYGKSKVEAESYMLNNFQTGVSFRLATVFGASPRLRLDLLVNDLVWKAKRDGVLVLFEEHFRRNYIHIKDVCNAFILGMKYYDKMKGQAYNVGLSSANLTKRQLAEKIKEHLPKTVIISSEIGEDPDKRDYLVSNEKIEKMGWFPQYTIDDGIEELIQAYDMVKGAGDVFRNF